jgi:hypothetical protein
MTPMRIQVKQLSPLLINPYFLSCDLLLFFLLKNRIQRSPKKVAAYTDDTVVLLSSQKDLEVYLKGKCTTLLMEQVIRCENAPLLRNKAFLTYLLELIPEKQFTAVALWDCPRMGTSLQRKAFIK